MSETSIRVAGGLRWCAAVIAAAALALGLDAAPAFAATPTEVRAVAPGQGVGSRVCGSAAVQMCEAASHCAAPEPGLSARERMEPGFAPIPFPPGLRFERRATATPVVALTGSSRQSTYLRTARLRL